MGLSNAMIYVFKARYTVDIRVSQGDGSTKKVGTKPREELQHILYRGDSPDRAIDIVTAYMEKQMRGCVDGSFEFVETLDVNGVIDCRY